MTPGHPKRRLQLASVLVCVGATAVAFASPASTTFHGRNDRIAYLQFSDAASTRGAIFTVRADGSGTRKLTHPSGATLTTAPDWSPDGRWIVYQVHRGGDITIVKIRRNGTNRTPLSQTCQGPPQCLYDSSPAWSPSGRRIAVKRDLCSTGSNNLQAIYTIGADGERARRITQPRSDCSTGHRFSDLAPQWAPNGKRIAFQRFDKQRGKGAIFTVRLDGTTLRRITPWYLDASSPDYSPNGSWILFSTHFSDVYGNIWLVHPNGEGRRAVTHTPKGSGKWLSGSFSPNGQKITAPMAPTGKNADVYIMNTDGSGRRNVTNTHRWDSGADWGSTPR